MNNVLVSLALIGLSLPASSLSLDPMAFEKFRAAYEARLDHDQAAVAPINTSYASPSEFQPKLFDPILFPEMTLARERGLFFALLAVGSLFDDQIREHIHRHVVLPGNGNIVDRDSGKLLGIVYEGRQYWHVDGNDSAEGLGLFSSFDFSSGTRFYVIMPLKAEDRASAPVLSCVVDDRKYDRSSKDLLDATHIIEVKTLAGLQVRRVEYTIVPKMNGLVRYDIGVPVHPEDMFKTGTNPIVVPNPVPRPWSSRP